MCRTSWSSTQALLRICGYILLSEWTHWFCPGFSGMLSEQLVWVWPPLPFRSPQLSRALALQAEGIASLAVTGGNAADSSGEFGLTLLIDQKSFFLIESDDFLKNICVSTNEYICIIYSLVTTLPPHTCPTRTRAFLPPGSHTASGLVWSRGVKAKPSAFLRQLIPASLL